MSDASARLLERLAVMARATAVGTLALALMLMHAATAGATAAPQVHRMPNHSHAEAHRCVSEQHEFPSGHPTAHHVSEGCLALPSGSVVRTLPTDGSVTDALLPGRAARPHATRARPQVRDGPGPPGPILSVLRR